LAASESAAGGGFHLLKRLRVAARNMKFKEGLVGGFRVPGSVVSIVGEADPSWVFST
jgi:hypothetical protein